MKPKNFPDRKLRRRLRVYKRGDLPLPPDLVGRQERDLRSRDIRAREKAGNRRKPGKYKGGLSRGA